MQRRVKLGAFQDLATTTPDVKFSSNGKSLIIAFAFKSEAIPSNDPVTPTHPKRNTHRDIIDISGSVYGGSLDATLYGSSEDSSTVVLTLKLNSKVPGTGAGLVSAKRGGAKKAVKRK
ncbi:hypothetical protein ACFQ21_11665 [Ohtaekwangia kribbensis]|jgi:hypothetical protein|uniref:Uncharacterized protein n=1 Tax=Ohtaekwangia kribbensis TaxID=688913 RepID=A0ABW3K238_9BACT